MNDFKDRLQQEASQLFKDTLPKMCERLHTMLNDPMFSKDTIEQVCKIVRTSCQNARREIREKEAAGEAREEDEDEQYFTPMQSDNEQEEMSDRKLKRKLHETKDPDEKEDECDEEMDNTLMECNSYISKLIDVLKPEIRELIECCNTVKTWVQLQIPEIQDGNNFGVEVQEEILEEVRKVEDDSNNFLKTLSVYHLTRAEVVSKFVKYDGISDYVSALEQLDVKEFVTLRLIALELRNYCVSLLDLFEKNMERIMTPRGISNANMLVY